MSLTKYLRESSIVGIEGSALVQEGAEGIILGCTEIGLLVKQEASPVRLFDTTEIHARAAVKYALADDMSLS